jgi:hypothetical protein
MGGLDVRVPGRQEGAYDWRRRRLGGHAPEIGDGLISAQRSGGLRALRRSAIHA